MVEMPKNKEEFECLMKKRMEANHYDYGFGGTIKVKEDGTPFNDKERRIVCEFQKIALGSTTGYFYCGPVERAYSTRKRMDDVVYAEEGDYIRNITVRLPESEAKEWGRLFVPVVLKVKGRTNKGYYPEHIPQVCAFPGGCD